MGNFRKFKWLCALLCALLFLLIALLLEPIMPLDTLIYEGVSSLRSPFMTGFFQVCTALAGPLVLLVICFWVVFLLREKQYRVPVMLNLMLSVLLNFGLKSAFQRPRPASITALVVESGYSFPSGHTMAAACFYGFLIFLLLRLPYPKWFRKLAITFLAAVIVLIGASRIYLGVHYFSDVLAGFCISTVYLIFFTSFVDKYMEHPQGATPHAVTKERGSLRKSFSYAFEGILAGLRTERNMVIHFGVMALVVVFGVVFQLSIQEWITCIFLFGLVFMAELVNTAIEAIVDMVMPEMDPRAKIAKDTAAGAVFVVSIAAAVIGALIFVPKILSVIHSGAFSQAAK